MTDLALIDAVLNASSIRKVVEGGKEYFVAPISLIVPGVLPGSKGPLLYPESEVRANPGIWNNVPIVVYHPIDPTTGIPLSAKERGVIDRSGIGFLRNDRYENGKRIADGYIDAERVKRIDPRVYDVLSRNGRMETSTGLYTKNLQALRNAQHNGRGYHSIATQYRPDHLAILPDQVGACSLSDGCGLNVNAKYDEDDCPDYMDTEECEDWLDEILGNADNEDGRWITTSTGAKVFIKDGQDVGDAIKERFASKHNPEITYGNKDDRDSDDRYFDKEISKANRDVIKAKAALASKLSEGEEKQKHISDLRESLSAADKKVEEARAAHKGSVDRIAELKRQLAESKKRLKAITKNAVDQLLYDLATNFNPEGCNQHTGPNCTGTSIEGSGKDKGGVSPADARLKSHSLSTTAATKSLDAVTKYPHPEAEKAAQVARKASRLASTGGLGTTGKTPEHHEKAARAHEKAVKAHVNATLSGTISDEGRKVHAEAAEAHRKAVEAHREASHVTRNGLISNSSDIWKVGDWLSKNGLMPGYGQIFVNDENENVLDKVWYVGGDGDEEGFGDLVEEKLKEAGAKKVIYEAEAFPPKDQSWIQVYPERKAWVSMVTRNSNPDGCNQHTGPGCSGSTDINKKDKGPQLSPRAKATATTDSANKASLKAIKEHTPEVRAAAAKAHSEAHQTHQKLADELRKQGKHLDAQHHQSKADRHFEAASSFRRTQDKGGSTSHLLVNITSDELSELLENQGRHLESGQFLNKTGAGVKQTTSAAKAGFGDLDGEQHTDETEDKETITDEELDELLGNSNPEGCNQHTGPGLWRY